MRSGKSTHGIAMPLALCLSALSPTHHVLAEETIRVGIVLPLSGSQSYFGDIERHAFEMALEEINAGGGVRGARLEFVIEDDRSRPEAGVAAVSRLIDEQRVVMLGGGYSSAVTARLAEVAQQREVPFLINTASADAITEKGWEWIFRLNPTASEYAAAAVGFLEETLGPRSVAVLHEDTAFGQSQSKFFEEACRAANIAVPFKASYSAAEFPVWRISHALLELRRWRPDVVFMVSYVTDASLLMRQLHSLDWKPKLYLGGAGGFTMHAFHELARDDAEGVATVTLWHESLPYPGAREFHRRFEARYGHQADYHAAEAYAAAFVIADAIQRANSLAAADVRQALAATRLDTVFGPVEFVSSGGKTQQNRLPVYVAQWIEGELTLIWPEVSRPR